MKHAISVMAAILAASPAAAQYTGPGAQGTANNVKAVLERPIDDQYVVLRGNLTSQLAAEQYMFADGSGEIRVEIDREDLPAQTIDAATLVEITGEIEKDFMQTLEIDVDRIRVIDGKAATGS